MKHGRHILVGNGIVRRQCKHCKEGEHLEYIKYCKERDDKWTCYSCGKPNSMRGMIKRRES